MEGVQQTALTTPYASFRSRRSLRRTDLENIVLKSGHSLLLRVVDEDPVYVVGYYADVRNYAVVTTLTTVRKEVIALRLKVIEELSPDPGELKYGAGIGA